MKYIIVCCLLVGISAAPNVHEWSQIDEPQAKNDVRFDLSPYNETFADFKVTYGKTYKSQKEEDKRYRIFKENAKLIEQHNMQYRNGKKSYYLGINKLADMDHEEYKKWLGVKQTPKKNNSIASNYLQPSNLIAPDAVDWRTQGYVTPVKDQGQCGSCWSFSATGSLEGQHFRRSGELIPFSEQQLMDCSSAYGNQGCEGGLMDNAFNYVKEYGIESESNYPYKGVVGNCLYDALKVIAKCNGFVDIPSESEEALMEAVATVGPISVAIDASRISFQLYAGGIYNDATCSSTQLDHGVLAVGYGTASSDYWIVKNSWGTSWGMNGYIQMIRNQNNQCGIATMASYPTDVSIV